MQWEIHALGDAAWVHYVINAVSSITGYGTLGAIGAMLGLLAMVFSGATSKGGPQLDMSWFVIAFVVFYAFFIPRADRVLITEVNPPSHLPAGRVFVVDNVPMGLAVVGSVVTKLGLALAQEYDTTFGSVEDTDRVLTGAVGANIRRIADLRMMQDLSFSDSSGTFALNRKNMVHYMAGCTVPGIAMGHVTWEQVMAGTSPTEMEGLLDRIRYGQPVRRTEFFRDDGSAEILDCDVAHDRLVRQMTGPNGIGDGLGKALAERGRGETPALAFDRLAGTFTQFGYDAEALQTFAAANVMYAVHLDAIMGDSTNRHNQAMITMVEQALAQRNMQFAAEESMFVALLRPSVSFFEALFYALAPVIAFLLPMGTMGLKLVGKYVLFAVWVVLYFPLLAIIGAFGDMQFAGAMEALRDVALTPYGSVMVLKEAQNTLGTVSLLAAAVPQLALAIIMGGPVAMSALASRMQGGDMVDEKVAAPAAASNGAFVAQGASFTGTPGEGVVRSGSPLQTYQLQDSLSSTVSSSRTEQQQATEQYSHTLQSTMARLQEAKQSDEYKRGGDYKAAIDEAWNRGTAVQDALARQQGDQADRKAGTNSTFTGGSGVGGGANGGNVSGAAGTTDSQGGNVGKGTVLKRDETVTDQAAHVRNLSEAYAKSLSAASSLSGTDSISAQDAESVQHQSADVYSKTLAYQEATTAASGLTSSLSFNDAQIADKVENGAAALGYRSGEEALAAIQRDLPPSAMEYFENTKAELESRGDFRGDASAAALWRTVNDGRNHVPAADRDELSVGAARMAQLIAGQYAGMPTGDATDNRGVAGSVAHGAAREKINEIGAPQGPQISRSDVANLADAAEAGAENVLSASDAAIKARQDQVSAAPDNMLPASPAQHNTRVEAAQELVSEHREKSVEYAAEAIAARNDAPAFFADLTARTVGGIEDLGRRAADATMNPGATLRGEDAVAETEGEIAVANEQFQHHLEEAKSMYADKGWSDGEMAAYAAYETWKSGTKVTQEQLDVYNENAGFFSSVTAQAMLPDDHPEKEMRRQAVDIDIDLPAEFLEKR